LSADVEALEGAEPQPERHKAQTAAPFDDSSRAQSPPLRRFLEYLSLSTVGNPILVKEFRSRMRGARSYWVLLIYTLLLAGIMAIRYFIHEMMQVDVSSAPGSWTAAAGQGARDLGQWIYYFAFIAQSIMVMLITPALTAGGITIEREQRSYEFLVTTPLRPVDLIRGKLTAAVAFVVLLLTASLPLVSMSFLVGGVSPSEIFFSYLIIALSAFVYGAIGIFWSATLRSTAIATVVTYLTVLSLFIATVIPGMIAWGMSMGAGGTAAAAPFQSLNPLAATLRAVHTEYFFAAELPSWIGGSILNLLFGLLIATAAMAQLEHFDAPPPFWIRIQSTLLWIAVGAFSFGPILGELVRKLSATTGARELVAAGYWWALALVLLVTPIYCTGDLIMRRGESTLKRYLKGFLPHRMFAADLSSGYPLLLLWAAIMCGWIALAFIWTGKGAMLKPELVWLPGLLLTLAVMTGIAGMGNFLSVVLPSRWAACVMTYLAGVLMIALPSFTLLAWAGLASKPKGPEVLYQALYLNPFVPLQQLGNPADFRMDMPALALSGPVPVWAVTALIYLGIGGIGFLLTLLRIQKEAG
jgi:hypothetical protein